MVELIAWGKYQVAETPKHKVKFVALCLGKQFENPKFNRR